MMTNFGFGPIIFESLTCKISLLFILIIFAKGHIMNSSFVAIVPLYALVLQRTVMWSLYQFADFARLKQLSPCIRVHHAPLLSAKFNVSLKMCQI